LTLKNVFFLLGLITFDPEMKANMYKIIRHQILEYFILLLNLLKEILKE
jgi:hypothetical protein